MLLRIVGFVVVGIGVALAVTDPGFGGIVLFLLFLAVIGGGGGAALMIALNRRQHQPPLAVPDAFAENQPEGMLNVSKIRVAGLGGLGMVAVALAMALTIPAIGVSLGLGLIGGFLIAVALIPYRRAHAGQRG